VAGTLPGFSAKTGATLKSVLTWPKLAPRLPPTYQPVQLYTGAGAGSGAFIGISAANAGVPINPAMAITPIVSLFIRSPRDQVESIPCGLGVTVLPLQHSEKKYAWSLLPARHFPERIAPVNETIRGEWGI